MMLRGLALAASLCCARPHSEDLQDVTKDNVLDVIYREHFPRGHILEDGEQDTIDELEKENPPQNSSERKILDDLEGMGRFQTYLKRHQHFLEGEAMRYKDLHERAKSDLSLSLQRREADLEELSKHLGGLKRVAVPPGRPGSLGEVPGRAGVSETPGGLRGGPFGGLKGADDDDAVPQELLDADRSFLELHANADPLPFPQNRRTSMPDGLAAEVKEVQRRLAADMTGHAIL